MMIGIGDKIILNADEQRKFLVTNITISATPGSGNLDAKLSACYIADEEKPKVLPVTPGAMAFCKTEITKPWMFTTFGLTMIPECLTKVQQWHITQIGAKLRREGCKMYRLKRWFLSLRFVNNWLWRRANKVRIYYCLKNECTRDSEGGTDCCACNWRGYCRDVEPPQNTMLLPDYSSIRELSNERPEE